MRFPRGRPDQARVGRRRPKGRVEMFVQTVPDCLFVVFPIFGSKCLVFGGEFPIRGSVGDPEKDRLLTDYEYLE
ncbi:hypothetical protein NDU88_002312 [Pleurodeles waltl]|uniref:Uncharacterized protein n=1 Tax=Pleurodeles waltl TaxID=8319 RepID=A0AAV7M067_PLEWA|nr:hypothetical protein NDU88_002312 [Pleurodeles waltl]